MWIAKDVTCTLKKMAVSAWVIWIAKDVICTLLSHLLWLLEDDLLNMGTPVWLHLMANDMRHGVVFMIN